MVGSGRKDVLEQFGPMESHLNLTARTLVAVILGGQLAANGKLTSVLRNH